MQLLHSVLGNIARARDETYLPLQRISPGSEHLLGEVDGAVSGCFRSDDGATPGKALTCEHAAELITESLVLAKKVPYLAPTHPDITRRHICIGSDVAEELAHEALAEAHHLIVTLTLGVEVGAALAAAHGQSGQSVLE